jgi:universal stress protein A
MAARYRKILIAVDASDDADQVLESATGLHVNGGESFYVVTVIPPMMGGVSGMGGASIASAWPIQDMEATMTREITDSVRERVARFGIAPDRVAVLYGRPVTEIHAQANKIGADLVVVGSHGRHGLSRVMLGSTANGVLHGAKCDVLTIRIGD